MSIVIVVFCVLVATVTAQVHHGGQQAQEHGHVGYQFEYGVKDPHTHDAHSQKEHRDGKNVEGEYTLHDPDGTERIVKYVSGPHSGFEAIVERKGHAQHPAHYGKHSSGEKGGVGGTSYVGVVHWSNQGYDKEH